MPKFNESQLEAIGARNAGILVSAAAGSGKTTVMVEKIKQTLIDDPEASLSQFLVITFTRDAARNMKDKLRELLEQAAQEGSAAAEKALGEIETASISTIHSFCTELLKEYNDDEGATMNPRVLKNTEKKHMLDEAFSDAAERILGEDSESGPQDRKAVAGLFIAFGPDELREMVERLYDGLTGIPEPFDFLERVVRTPPVELWDREILSSIDLDLLGLGEALRREEELMADPLALSSFEKVFLDDRQIINDFLDRFGRAESADEKHGLLCATREAFVKAPSPRKLEAEEAAWKDRINKVREEIKGYKGIFAAAAKKIETVLGEGSVRANETIRQELRGLELLVRGTAEAYEQQKREAGAIDYADMEQTAYRIMKDPDKQSELLARYRYVYVDEYQDVSGIQDAIIGKLAGPGHRTFMVGDIKQSIYGFRHAEPDFFREKRERFADGEDAEERRIFFMDNYRSCQSVVDAVNEVFTEAMDRRITDMDYLPEDHLRCNKTDACGPVDVILVDRGDGDADRLEAQCEAVGRYIQSILATAPQAGDRETFRYRDIVILLRSTQGVASEVVEHLKKMHIPALYQGVPDFFGLAEVKSFLSLLTVLDNLHNDDALVGTLINTPFLFSDSDLADIRLEKQEHVPFYEAFELCAGRDEKPIDRKCRQAAEQLEAWRKVSEGMPVPDFVWWLMRETGIYAARGAYPDGKARQANLDALYQRAVDGQASGNMRLSDFVADLRETRETKGSDSDDPPALGEGDDFVRVMTMHKSKGLEFPVVILMNLQREISGKQNQGKLRADIGGTGDALGLYLPAVRRQRNSTADSQGAEAFRLRKRRKDISEETRLLYVAMTRAERKLCLVGSIKDGDDKNWRNGNRPWRIWQTKTMLDMLMPAVLGHMDLPEAGETMEDGPWRLRVVSGKAIGETEETLSASDAGLQEILSADAPMRMYLPETIEPTPLKTSVTTLTRKAHILSEADSEETVEDKRKAETAVRTFRLGSVPSRPAFLEEEKTEAVDIGTATHRFLRLIDLDVFRREGVDVEQAVRQEAERMTRSGILTPEEAALIRLRGAASFLRSDLGLRMLRSADVRRETTFTMRIDPDRPTMVQGIVDCLFREDGDWILIDYKTDRDTAPETFVPRHEAQMNWYRTAVERLTGIPVREMWLFTLRAGKAYPVERQEVGE